MHMPQPRLALTLPMQGEGAAKEAHAGAMDAAIPPEVATASTSTAVLPETPSGPHTRSMVQNLASRSTHRQAGWGCFGMPDGGGAASGARGS